MLEHSEVYKRNIEILERDLTHYADHVNTLKDRLKDQKGKLKEALEAEAEAAKGG